MALRAWGGLVRETGYVAGTVGSPESLQSTQVDFVCLLRRIHSLCPALEMIRPPTSADP
jgi:hypothetical protein